jgi:hypothetical protein
MAILTEHCWAPSIKVRKIDEIRTRPATEKSGLSWITTHLYYHPKKPTAVKTRLMKLFIQKVGAYEPRLLECRAWVLTLENMEPINCMVAKVLGGSLASIPSNALDNETIRRLMNTFPPPRWTGFIEEDDRDVRSSERPTNAVDITTISNWWVAVIWLDTKYGKSEVNQMQKKEQDKTQRSISN